MKAVFDKYLSQIVFVLAIGASIGLFFSRAVLSIATVLFGLLSLYLLISNAKPLLKNKLIVSAMLFVLWLALSFFYTSEANHLAFLNELSFKLSFLAILLATFSVELSKKQLLFILLAFSYLAMTVAVGTFIHYLSNYSEINELISKSKPIPVVTGYFHISYSLMLAFSILASFWVLFLAKKTHPALQKWFWIPFFVNLVLIHIIAARTGLVAIYISFGATGFFYLVIEKKQIFRSLVLLIALMVLGIVAVSVIKPLNNRYENTVKDLQVYFNNGNPNWWSGAMRLEAIENSWYIFLENPWTGVGMADLNDEVQMMYEKKGTLLLPENRVNPHNQFVNILVASGIIGLFFFLSILVIAFAKAFYSANYLLLGFLFMFVIGFSLESFLERQFGTCFFGLALGLLYRQEFSQNKFV